MDLSYGARYEALRAEVRAFLAASWPPRARTPLSRSASRSSPSAAAPSWPATSPAPSRSATAARSSRADPLAAQVIREEFARARAPGEARGHRHR